MGYQDTPEVSGKLVPWAKSMKKDFKVTQERLSAVELKKAENSTHQPSCGCLPCTAIGSSKILFSHRHARG